MTDLAATLPTILPKAVAWAEKYSTLAMEHGLPLNSSDMVDARSVGVAWPERIRVAVVPQLPLPDDVELRAIALGEGLLDSGIVGLTLGHAIYVVQGHETRRLLSHEFRHVHQYEVAGSIAAFLAVYLPQIAAVGYRSSPLEIDARQHELG